MILFMLLALAWKIPTTVEGCENGFSQHVPGKCYKTLDGRTNYNTAKEKCEELEANLPMPKSEAEVQALKMSGKSF